MLTTLYIHTHTHTYIYISDSYSKNKNVCGVSTVNDGRNSTVEEIS